MAVEKGKILSSCPMYTDDCLSLLRQALLVAEASEHGTAAAVPDTRVGTFQSRYADSSSEEEDGNAKDGSASSSEESSSAEDETDTVSELPSAKPLTNEGLPLEPTNDSKPKVHRKKTKKVTIDERQREAQIRKHVENMVSVSLPLADPESTALHLASSLLPKEDRLFQNTADYCRSFLSLAATLQEKPVIVLLLRSGRFAGGVFQGEKCIAHRTLQRYTVRKGQGKAQSAQDGNRRPKSMGSQLRRAGEQSLREDVTKTLLDWRDHVAKAALIMVSCPKTMKKGLFEGLEDVLVREDPRVRRVPIDFGRPTFENVELIHSVLMRGTVRELLLPTVDLANEDAQATESGIATTSTNVTETAKKEEPRPVVIPLTALHQAAGSGNVQAITDILGSALETTSADLDFCAGQDLMTPLHYAAESAGSVGPAVAAECVLKLLVQGRANPTLIDGRNRVPYFLASHDKVRDAFRMARASLGEDFCDWDKDAKVGPPLTEQDLELRKQKELDKRRKKKKRQQKNKAQEKSQAAEVEEEKRVQETAEKEVQDAKRIRDGLQPKVTSATNVCDFCQKVCKGRRRNQMFKRLDYAYCTTECVQKHKRELMAAAALSRFDK